MSDEETQDQAPTPASAETKNAEKPGDSQEHMIPKSRFDEVNTALKEAKTTLEKIQREREEAEKEKAEKQGEWERLYRESQDRINRLQGEVQRRDLDLLKRQVAEKVGIPQLWNRLQGEDETALTEDAESLKSSLPKPQAPPPDGGAGRRDRGEVPETMSDAAVNEFAARLGLKPEAVKMVLPKK